MDRTYPQLRTLTDAELRFRLVIVVSERDHWVNFARIRSTGWLPGGEDESMAALGMDSTQAVTGSGSTSASSIQPSDAH